MSTPRGRGFRLLTAGVLITSASALALGCSGDVGDGDATDEARPLEGMVPAASNMGPAAAQPGATPPSASTSPQTVAEGPRTPAGLDDTSAPPAASAGMQGSGDATSPDDMTTDPNALAVPATDYCAEVADWDPEWVQFEEEVLLLVNENRAQPADCGVEGQLPATTPITMDPILRCSARLHSLDMFERDFFDHDNPDGLDPFERMADAGFSGGGGGENIAVGQATPEQVMQSWMESDGHCANVMRGAFATIGVGYHAGAGRVGLGSNFWTQNFGAPPPTPRGRGR